MPSDILKVEPIYDADTTKSQISLDSNIGLELQKENESYNQDILQTEMIDDDSPEYQVGSPSNQFKLEKKNKNYTQELQEENESYNQEILQDEMSDDDSPKYQVGSPSNEFKLEKQNKNHTQEVQYNSDEYPIGVEETKGHENE